MPGGAKGGRKVDPEASATTEALCQVRQCRKRLNKHTTPAILDATGLRVDDTGPGIPAEELPCLFEQGPGCRRQARGEGIGLPLVKRIADHQGWGISAENRPEEGASFRLEFLPGPGEASRAHTHLDAPFTPP